MPAMLLVVDVGNTQTHFGLLNRDDGSITEHWRFATVRESTGDQLGAALANLLALRGYSFDSWIGLLGPAGIPPQTVEAISAAVAKLLKDRVILERLDKQGIVPQAMSPQAFGELLRADYAKMARVVKLSGARID